MFCFLCSIVYHLINLHSISFPQNWSAEKIKTEIQSENTDINWSLFEPSKDKLIVLEYGYGGADVVREHLKSRDNEMVYGLMRFTFDFLSGTKMSKLLCFVWYESLHFMSFRKNVHILFTL